VTAPVGPGRASGAERVCTPVTLDSLAVKRSLW
jgi:hypothetical protein